jgi:hypothetical protein
MGKKLAVFETPAGTVKLSAKGRQAFDALCATAGDGQLAAKVAGLSDRQVRRILAMPGIRDLMRQRARDTVAKGAPMAANRLLALASQDEARKTSLDASLAILGIEGIKPPAAGLQINLGVGFVGCVLADKSTPEEVAQAEKAIGRSGPGYIVNWNPQEATPDRHAGSGGYVLDLRENNDEPQQVPPHPFMRACQDR